MSRRKTKTVFVCAVLGTETPTLNLKFRREPYCKPAATRQFLTKARCQTGPRSTLQWVRLCPLEKGPSTAYISQWTKIMNLLKAVATQRRFRKFRQPVPNWESLAERYSTWRYKRIICSVGRLARQVQLVDKGKRQVRSRRWVMSSRCCFQAMLRATHKTNLNYMKLNLKATKSPWRMGCCFD